MGGSRRRLKRTRRKVRVGVVKRKANVKAQVPLELADGRQDVQERLNTTVSWETTDTLTRNYGANRLLLDPNEGFGRNQRAAPLKTPEQREAADGATHEDDDELRAACGKERKSGAAPPKRLTTHQRAIVERLVDAHGDDVEAMFRDRKRNPMQHSVGKLRELLESFRAWGAQSKHDFRVPNKRPKGKIIR